MVDRSRADACVVVSREMITAVQEGWQGIFDHAAAVRRTLRRSHAILARTEETVAGNGQMTVALRDSPATATAPMPAVPVDGRDGENMILGNRAAMLAEPTVPAGPA